MRLSQFAFLSIFMACVLVLFAPGCGRTSLEPESLGGDASAPKACGPDTCPTGCCDAVGACRVGSDTRACGLGGGRCADCVAQGLELCDGTRRSCGRNVSQCNPSTCPVGCCSVENGRERCLAGIDGAACGQGGNACVDCNGQGRSCNAASRSCNAAKCDASNCAGCCVGDRCLTGRDDLSCGKAGAACQSCSSNGQTCQSSAGGGGQCTGVASCGPQNCGGCCNGTTCVFGADSVACGRQGQACTDCTAAGQVCVAAGQPNERTCQAPPPCGPGNCAGCCVGNACVGAPTPQACGKGGAACTACGANETCNAGVCQAAAACNAQNCAGCCIGDICSAGDLNTACGVAGGLCQNCAAQNNVCQNGACQAAACGPGNCPNGCCAGNTCVQGNQDGACGLNGAQCTDCVGNGQVCKNQQCAAGCGPGNCAGCCQGGQCIVGFGDAACGSGGAACANCQQANQTCNTNAVPRVCTNANTCPQPAAACNNTPTPKPATLQGLCNDLDLDALAGVCAGGPNDPACVNAFAALAQTSPACATCLAPFDVPFGQFTGLFRCAAPSLSNNCNIRTGCVLQCVTSSCSTCDAASKANCEAQLGGGQCQAALNQTGCATAALLPPSLCSPLTYGGSFGGWLRAVGDRYCGNGP